MQRAAPWLVWPILDVRVEAWGTTRIVVAQGEIDITALDTLGRAIDRAIEDVPELVVVDLGETGFLDSTVVHLMVAAERHARARGVRLQIIPAPAAVHRVFTLCGVEKSLPFVGTPAGAPPGVAASHDRRSLGPMWDD